MKYLVDFFYLGVAIATPCLVYICPWV